MAPPPLATAAAAEYREQILEVCCVGCRETLEVERGLTEFVCPDCGTPQSLPPELMPPPRRRALPMPRGLADARGARLPCGACGELLSVPVGLSRCVCPFCGAELAVDSASLRNYILSSAAAAVVQLAPAPVSPIVAPPVAPIVAARETWQERSSYTTHAGVPRAEPNARLIPMGRTQIERPSHLIHVHRDEQEHPDHTIYGEKIQVANETVANNSLQRNRLSHGHCALGNEERHGFPLNEVRDHVNDQHPDYTIQPKRPQLARLHRVIHSEEMQEGPLSHEVYREARRTELIYETAATCRNQTTVPQSSSVEEKHMETPSQIIQQVHKHPYRESHARSWVVCLDMDGVVHPPFNQANHGQEASTEIINKTLAKERNIWPTGCSVGPNSVSVEKRNQVKQKTQKQQSDVTRAEDPQQEHLDQAGQEPINHTTHKEAMSSLPIKETTARCSKQKKPQFVNAKPIGKKRHVEPLNHIVQQAEGHTSDSDCHEIRVDFERQSKGNERHGSTSTLEEREQVIPPNKLTDLKQKNVCSNYEIQKEQIEVNVSKQTSSCTQKNKRKGSMASSNAGLQLRRSARFAKDSVAAVENEPIESDLDDLQDFAPNIQVPSVAMEEEPMEWEPFQRRSPSPSCEVSVATANTESVESEHDEHYDISPDQSTSEYKPPDIDRIIADLCPSTSSAHKMAQEISDESDDPDLTTPPSNTDMSDPEHFARNYCLSLRRVLAKKNSNVFLDRLMSQGSNKVSLHDLSDSEEQHVIKRKKAGCFARLGVKVWTFPEGVRVPVSLNTSGLPIGENAILLINFLGVLARDGTLAPLTYISWKKIPKENKSVMWHIVKLKFDVSPPCEWSIMAFIRNKRRVWKSQLKRKHYDSHATEEERLADRDPRVPKEQWRGLVAYWNTEKFKAISAAGKASRAKSTYINVTGSKSFARIRQEESRSGDTAHENPEGSGGDYASATGAERRGRIRRRNPGPSPKDLQGRSASQTARAKRKAGDEASTLREEVVVTEESEDPRVKETRAEKSAEDETVALRKKVVVMEESQKKLQEDLARMANAMSTMQKMMSTGGFPMVPPKL